MRVVIVTGQRPHHKNLCVQLARAHELVAILHPAATSRSHTSRWFARVKKQGLLWTLLNLTGQAGRRKLEQSFKAQESELAGVVAEFDQIATGIRHFVDDFGADSNLDRLKTLAPDVVVCLGGPVYPKSFIQACPLVLNYHSGISPVYNGTATIWFAFANGHPQWCGGTLMTMNTVVDGGDILGHFLPDISENDNPASLFHKTTLGAAEMYSSLLKHLETSPRFSRVSQPRPLFYYRAVDWTLTHTLQVKRHLRQKTCARFVRNQAVIEHWRENSETAAAQSFENLTHRLLLGRGT
ncbi:MAG TPA: formyltransferase family protein [Verrucomicrobiae bacterium]|nr:formyltransferase family protein [Verrucomicrobiae bacterium]